MKAQWLGPHYPGAGSGVTLIASIVVSLTG